jgi:hypothetical protein
MKSLIAAALASSLLCGCAVVAVADLAVGAAVGAVKLTGKAVGAVVDVVTPSSDDKK